MSDENVDSPEAWDDMDELEPTAEELAEAASLARSMDGVSNEGAEAVDEVVMATASLLAYSEGSELREDRAAAVLKDVLETVKRPGKNAEPIQEKAPGRGWWRLLAPLPFAGAAAAAFFVLNAETVVPAPSLSLVAAQASAAAGEDGQRLDDEMSDYRRDLYAALEEGY